MSRKTVYLVLCALGIALPYWQFVLWVIANGLNPRLFVQELFANRIGAFFVLDVFVSAVVLFCFIATEGKRLRMRHQWLPVVATMAVGVSLGLPLFLYLREGASDLQTGPQSPIGPHLH